MRIYWLANPASGLVVFFASVWSKTTLKGKLLEWVSLSLLWYDNISYQEIAIFCQPLIEIQLTDPYYGSTDQTVKVLKILNLLQSQLNFTYQLIALPKASGIGIRQENGSWSGLIGLLERKVHFLIPTYF